MLKSSLCNYSDRYILVKGTIIVTRAWTGAAARRADDKNKGVIFKHCARFTNCISEISNTQKDNANGIDVVRPMYNLIVIIIQKHLEVYGNIQRGAKW